LSVKSPGGGGGGNSVTAPITGDGSAGSPLALDLSAAFTFTGLQTISSAEPRLRFNETDVGADLKLWDVDVNASVLTIRTRTDADGAGVNAIAVTRGATTAITNIAFGNATNNPTYTFLGSGAVTAGGFTTTGVGTIGRVSVTSTTIPGNGIYRPATDQLAFASATTLRGMFDATGQFIISTAGRGISLPEGANAKMGVATLVGGTVVVATTAVTATSRIFLTCQSLGTVAVPSGYCVSARTAATSFTILASAPTDTSVIAWMILEPT
jgi:hypothetical protein